MTIPRTIVLTVGLVLGAWVFITAPVLGAAPDQTSTASAADWREQYAYTLGVQAYLYGLPWVYMPEVRWTRVVGVPGQRDTAPVNGFFHVRTLVDASTSKGGAPNNDTLYSRAWLNVGPAPVILSVPEIHDRYYTFEFASFDSDNFAYVGTRTTGTRGGNYAIVGPHWQGQLPSGVVALPPSPTPWVFVVGRTLVTGTSDLPTVHAIQDQYKLTLLSQWGKPESVPTDDHGVWKPFDRTADPLADWKTMNRALAENPPPAGDAALLQSFARIGISPGLDVEAQDAATKRGLARAAADGRKLIGEAFTGGYGQKQVNGWMYPPPSFGRVTPTRDWLMRAIQCQVGIVANDPEEAVYLNVSLDGAGEPLSGAHRYALHFAPGGLPKVQAFWSVTMYDTSYNLVANPIDRYSIGDRTADVKRDADGGLTLYVQHDKPASDKVSNWLPAPANGFFLVLRTYLPDESLVKQTWQPPPLRKVP